MIDKIRTWITTDGPGHSNYPKRDIEAHRSTAKWVNRIGTTAIVIFLLAAFISSNDSTIMGYGVTMGLIYGFTRIVSQGLRLESMEWENELIREKNNE